MAARRFIGRRGPSFSHIPLNFDLPDAEVEILSLTPQVAEFRVRFPAAPPTSVTSGAPDLIAAQLDEALSMIIEATAEEAEAPKVSADGWANKLGLSPRQRDVFARLVQGRANKEIAAQLQCSERNVEFHVGRIFRAARVTSRAELLVKVLGQAAANVSPRPAAVRGRRSDRAQRWMRTVGVAPVNSARTVIFSPAFTLMRSPRLSPVGSNVKRTSCWPGSRLTRTGQAPRIVPSIDTRVPGSPRNATIERPVFSAPDVLA